MSFKFNYNEEEYYLHFKHDVITEEDVTANPSLANIKAVTTCTISKGVNQEPIIVGNSICAKGDVFNKEYGRRQSLYRAVNAVDETTTEKQVLKIKYSTVVGGIVREFDLAPEINMPVPMFSKEFRTAVWDCYFNRIDGLSLLQKYKAKLEKEIKDVEAKIQHLTNQTV